MAYKLLHTHPKTEDLNLYPWWQQFLHPLLRHLGSIHTDRHRGLLLQRLLHMLMYLMILAFYGIFPYVEWFIRKLKWFTPEPYEVFMIHWFIL